MSSGGEGRCSVTLATPSGSDKAIDDLARMWNPALHGALPGDNDVRSSPVFPSRSPSGADQAVSRTDVLHDDATSLPAICQSVADEILLTSSRLTPVSSDGLAGC